MFDDYFNVNIDTTMFKTISWAMIPLFLKINVATPIIEELGFRLPMLSNKSMLVISSLVYFIGFPFFAKSELGSQTYWIIFSIGIVYYLFLYFLQFKNKTLTIYFSAFLFGSAHLVNFPLLTWDTLLPCWFNVIPQMISGVLLAKLRISKGIIYSIYFHMIINLFVTFFQIYRN